MVNGPGGDCPTKDMWYGINICRKTKQGWEICAVQTHHLVTFPAEFMTGTAIDHGNFFDHQKTNLTSQLSFCFQPEWDLLRGVSDISDEKERDSVQTGLWENYWKESSKNICSVPGRVGNHCGGQTRHSGEYSLWQHYWYCLRHSLDPSPAQLPQCYRLCWKHLRIHPSDLGALPEVNCLKQYAVEEEEEERPQSETEWWWAPSLHRVCRLSSLTISLRVWSVSEQFPSQCSGWPPSCPISKCQTCF